MAHKKNIVILGSSGSIGESALDIVRQFKDRFRVLGLSVNSNIACLERQVVEFNPRYVAIADTSKIKNLSPGFKRRTKVFASREGVCRLASLKEADIILVSIVGAEAIFPLLSAIGASRTIALANKESIVIGGAIVLGEAKRKKARIVPIDSEQSAIFQCLEGQKKNSVETVYLTASGGPLVDRFNGAFDRVSVRDVLAHPRWKMGRKITVDSATLMNKGLEVIEAQHLFDIELERIKVLIHRQALVHSMVEFCDGSLLAQLGVTDMRLPIQYALTYPERWPNKRFRLDLLRMGALTFTRPDLKRFPCLALAYEAARKGGTAPSVLNAANEVAVAAFLENRLKFVLIPRVIESVLKKVGDFEKNNLSLDALFAADAAARVLARERVEAYRKRG